MNPILPVQKPLNWYPGSAALNQLEFLDFLERQYPGKWHYTDCSPFDWRPNPGHVQHIHNTFGREFDWDEIELPTAFAGKCVSTLVVSRHSGLKSIDEVQKSGLLRIAQPRTFLYTDGSTLETLSSPAYRDAFNDNHYFFSHQINLPQWGRTYNVYLRHARSVDHA